jgi:hypothetical protein
MRCSRCQAENPAGAKVCGQCGAPLGAGCLSCGAANPPENRFCGQCGAPLSKPGLKASASPEPRIAPILTPVGTLPGEMKQVSVLFCDIVNSTPLTERLGPERMRDLVHGFLLHLLGIKDAGSSPLLSNPEAVKAKTFDIGLTKYRKSFWHSWRKTPPAGAFFCLPPIGPVIVRLGWISRMRGRRCCTHYRETTAFMWRGRYFAPGVSSTW